jgi:hypothetical protein
MTIFIGTMQQAVTGQDGPASIRSDLAGNTDLKIVPHVESPLHVMGHHQKETNINKYFYGAAKGFYVLLKLKRAKSGEVS